MSQDFLWLVVECVRFFTNKWKSWTVKYWKFWKCQKEKAFSVYINTWLRKSKWEILDVNIGSNFPFHFLSNLSLFLVLYKQWVFLYHKNSTKALLISKKFSKFWVYSFLYTHFIAAGSWLIMQSELKAR